MVALERGGDLHHGGLGWEDVGAEHAWSVERYGHKVMFARRRSGDRVACCIRALINPSRPVLEVRDSSQSEGAGSSNQALCLSLAAAENKKAETVHSYCAKILCRPLSRQSKATTAPFSSAILPLTEPKAAPLLVHGRATPSASTTASPASVGREAASLSVERRISSTRKRKGESSRPTPW
jgi:hypothetical protein